MSNNVGIALLKQSFALLRQKKSLFLFSTLSTLLTISAFVIAFIPLMHMETAAWENGGHVSPKTFAIFTGIVLLLFWFLNMLYLMSNAALIACVTKYINNEPYSITIGFKTIATNIFRLRRWESYAAIVGLTTKLLAYWVDDWHESRTTKELLAQLPWSIAITLVIPVLITEKVKTREAVQHSAALMRKTWGIEGKSLRSNISTGLKVLMLRVVSMTPLIIGLCIGGKMPIIVGSTITATTEIIIMILHSATQATLYTALFLFATGKDTSQYYDQALLKKAFEPVKHTIYS